MKNILLLVCLSSLLIFIWFHTGHMLGTGEAGLPFYNTAGLLRFVQHTWSIGGIGLPTSISVISFPTYIIFSFVAKLGVSPVLLQAVIFFILILNAGIGMYFLAHTHHNKFIALFSSLFYLFNVFVLFNIWSRFQYTFIYFYSLLPLVFYFLIRGVSKYKIIYILAINIVLLVFSLTFAAFTLLEYFWILVGCYLFFELVINFKNRNKMKDILVVLFSVVLLWLFFNLWWVQQFIQVLKATPYISSQAYSTSNDINTVIQLSQRLGNLSYIFRLFHQDFLISLEHSWSQMYFNPIIIIISYFVPFLAFFPLLLKNKHKLIYFFLFLSLIIIFLMKGSEPPFGGLFVFAFSHIRFLEVFRNPFEKFGLALPLAYAPLVGLSLYRIFDSIRQRWGARYAKMMISIIGFSLFVVLVFPLWTGRLFTNNELPAKNPKIGYKVDVPNYYTDARKWMNKNFTLSRVVALPISGEGITYKWDYGYAGVELSNGLFDAPFLSFCTGIQFLCPIVNNLESLLINSPQDFWKVMGPLNAKYVMIRQDVDIKTRDLQDPNLLEEKLKQAQNIKKKKTFGKLTFYTLPDSLTSSEIFPASNGIFLNSDAETFISAIPLADYQKGDVYFTDSNQENLTLPYAKQLVLNAKEITSQNSQIDKNQAISLLPYVRYLPGQNLYPFIRFKEYLSLLLAGNNKDSLLKTYFDKRISEIYQLVQRKQYSISRSQLTEYNTDLQKIKKLLSPNSNVFQQELLRHYYIFQAIIKQLQDNQIDAVKYIATYDELKKILQSLRVLTQYPVDLTLYRSFSVLVPKDGKYNIELENRSYNQYFEGNITEVRVDGASHAVEIAPKSPLTTLLVVPLQKGKHQIDILMPKIRAKSLMPIRPLDPSGRYTVSFDYLIDTDHTPHVVLQEEHTNGNVVTKNLDFGFNWQKNKQATFSTTFSLSLLTRSAAVLVSFWQSNKCDIRTGDCNGLDKQPVGVNSIRIIRNDIGNIYLVKNQITPVISLPKISFQRINSADYRLNVRGATSPYFLNFLESFHPLWKAYYLEGNKRTKVPDTRHILINNYANSWYIDKRGNYQMEIEFLPEQSFMIGKVISGVAIIASLITFIIYGFVNLKRKYDR